MSEYVTIPREVVERALETVATLCAAITANDDDTMYQRSLMRLDAAVGALRAALAAGEAIALSAGEQRAFAEGLIAPLAPNEAMRRAKQRREQLLAAGEAKPEHDPARAVEAWGETLTTPQGKARFLARYFRQFERSGHAVDGQPLHLFTADVLDALAAGEARPVGEVVDLDPDDENGACEAIVQLQQEVKVGDLLYAAPPQPEVEAEREVDRTFGQIVTELTMRAVSGQHGPVFGPGGRELAAKLAQSPPEARAFLQRAGILGPDGLLAPEFRPDEEADPPQPAVEPRPEPVHEAGPWKARRLDEYHWCVESDDFTHDVHMRIYGDFGSDEKREAYAREIARRLNAAPPQPAEPRCLCCGGVVKAVEGGVCKACHFENEGAK